MNLQLHQNKKLKLKKIKMELTPSVEELQDPLAWIRL